VKNYLYHCFFDENVEQIEIAQCVYSIFELEPLLLYEEKKLEEKADKLDKNKK